jgi:predicted DCC family thiol-disulfide oxidoreductase YuxK
MASEVAGARLRGWVLYDDSCGVCRSWVPRWKKVLARRGFEIAPLQSAWVEDELHLPPEELLHDLRLLLVGGQSLQGADVYRHLMKHIWWTWPLYCLTLLPGAATIFDTAYRRFADNRHPISRSCGLPNRVE